MITDIGVDLDGVCYSFSKAFYAYASQRMNRDDLPEPLSWEFYKAWGLTSEEFRQWIVDGTRDANLFAQFPPEPFVNEMLTKFRAHNCRIHVVTNRPEESKEQTMEWLATWKVPHDYVIFTADKTDIVRHVDKLRFAGEIAMIEDNVENFVALESAGVRAYLYDQPWNRYYRTKKRIVLLYDFFESVFKHNAKLSLRKERV